MKNATKTKRKARQPTIGEQIIAGLEEALAYERGELTDADVKVRRYPISARQAAAAPPVQVVAVKDVASLRKQLHLSQSLFAQALSVSPETVRSWEQGRRTPEGAVLRLFEVMREHPMWIVEKVRRRA